MHLAVVTLFPELFEPFFRTSFVGKAALSGTLVVHLEDLRKHGLGKHRSVDDTPYGGGSGMVMRADITVAAMEAAEAALSGAGTARRVLLTPQGARFDQARARALSALPALTLVCGRYEGFDERVRHFVDEELSIGDFVLTGGEAAAMCVIEATVRLLPGVLGNFESTREESHGEEGLLEYPQYTRPADFRGQTVPEVLAGGNHAEIDKWRKAEALARTKARRPDLIK